MTANNALDCQDFVELVTAYLEGILPASERARFDTHIAGCDGCARYLAQMRETIGALGALTEESVPSPAMQDLLRVFRGWKAEQ
jgi:anti-sigma factor RsiW